MMNVLSIDAWRYDGGWTWNMWHKVGTVERTDFETLTAGGAKSNRRVIRFFREHGYLSEGSKGKVAIEDDGYNVVVIDKGTREPLFAIEYGPHY